jgi:hypothetical protein
VTHGLELTVVIHALKMCWYYLMGIKFILLTDNNGVNHFLSQHDLNARQERCLAFLSEFDFEVWHIKGKENLVEDALIQRTNGLYEVVINKVENDIKHRIKSTSNNDENYIKTTTKLQGNAENMIKIDLIIDKNGFLRFKHRLYVPKSIDLKLKILDELHKKPYFGHLGYQKMITPLRNKFYCPNMKNETNEYLSKCFHCQ